MTEEQIKQLIQQRIDEYTNKAKNQSTQAQVCITIRDRDFHHWLAVVAGAQAKVLKQVLNEIEHPDEEM